MIIIDDLNNAALSEIFSFGTPLQGAETPVRGRHETVLTVGAFDGVHLGHQALIARVVGRARELGCLAALITFHPHPAVVLAPHRAPRTLTAVGEKVALLEQLGIDLLAILPFDRQVAGTPARDFMTAVVQNLRLRELWVGPDFALGRSREGGVPFLRDLGRELGYGVHIVEPVVRGVGTPRVWVDSSLQGDQEGAVISSSAIRDLLAKGYVGRAAQMLGRYPSIAGEVVVGAQRGHALGFPTANLEVRPERAVPANGVYAVYAMLGANRYPAVANVGVRPSFDNRESPSGGGERIVETHIFDFDQDIYGCDLVVEFVARLRDERRFDDIADLVAQIDRDSQAARAILEHSGATLDPGAAEGDGAACAYRFEEIEHTADRALRVWSPQWEGLFVGAARGLYYLSADLDGLEAAHWREIRLEALDRESLLVEWLNELLFLTETEGLLFVAFDVQTVTEKTLVARVGGGTGEVSKAQIKAATFHNLEFARDETGWSTVVTFDV